MSTSASNPGATCGSLEDFENISSTSPVASSVCNSLEDFEDILEFFFIHKPVASSHTNGQNAKKKVLKYIPLLIRDILDINAAELCGNPRIKDFHAFDGLVHFRNCILYACVVGRLQDNASYYQYLIDDGTAIMELGIFPRTKDASAVCHMQNELNALEKRTKDEKKLKILQSLCRLLVKTMDQLDYSNITIGSNIFAFGRPTAYRGKISFVAFDVSSDTRTSRNMEIAYKDHLIDWYTRKYPALGVQLHGK